MRGILLCNSFMKCCCGIRSWRRGADREWGAGAGQPVSCAYPGGGLAVERDEGEASVLWARPHGLRDGYGAGQYVPHPLCGPSACLPVCRPRVTGAAWCRLWRHPE